MSKGINDIVAEIDAAKAADSNLDVLDSPSKVAVWKVWRYMIALAHKILYDDWDVKKAELEAVSARQYGKLSWWAEEIKKFQYGHALVEKDGKLVYSIDDPAARIIEEVSATDPEGRVIIKVAILNAGELEPLSTSQMVALQSYAIDIKPAGIRHTIVSTDADLLRLRQKVYYDGKLDPVNFQTAYEAALNLHITEGIGFDGILDVNKFTDACQAVPGVETLGPLELWAKPAGGSYVSVIHEYPPASGYFKFDPAYPLNNVAQIEYIPR